MGLNILNTAPVAIDFFIDEIDIVDTEIYSYLGYRDAIPDEYVAALINKLKNEIM